MNSLNFRTPYPYRNSASGIEVPLTVSIGTDQEIDIEAKVDTGAANCIFRREHAEALGIDVESTKFSTAAGLFSAYGHEVKLSCFGYEFEIPFISPANMTFVATFLGFVAGWISFGSDWCITTRLCS